MSMLHRKLRRDVWHARGQLGAIALVLACGVALFVALRSMHGYLRYRQAAYYREARFADLFVQVTRAPRSVAAQARLLPGVTQVEPRVVATAVLDLPGRGDPATGLLVSLPRDPGRMLNAVVLRRGRLPAAARADEVLLSDAFARANGLGPGDSLGAILHGRWEWLQVTGTAISPEFIYEIPPGGGSLFPDNRHFGVLWLPEAGLAAAFDLTGAFNDLAISLGPGAVPAEVITRLDRLLAPWGGRGAYARADQVSHRFLDSEIGETRVTSVLLPGLFLAVTAFLLHLVLGRLVATEREQIAVLKAFGWSNAAVARHYLAYALAPVGLGLLLGTGVGLWLAGAFAEIYARFYQFPDAGFTPDPGVLLLACAVGGGAALAGAVAAVRRVVALPPAEAMRPEAPAPFRPGWLDRAGVVRRVPVEVRSIARSIQRLPGRALLTTLGLALAIALTLVGRFTFDAIDYLRDVQFEQALRQDVTVGFDRELPAAVRWELARLPGVGRVELAREVPVRLRFGAAAVRTGIEGLEADGRLRRIVTEDGTARAVPSTGLLLSSWLARRLGAGAGDVVTVEVLDGRRARLQLPVAGTVNELLGEVAYARRDYLARVLEEGDLANSAYLEVAPGSRAALDSALRRRPRVAGVGWVNLAREAFDQTVAESFRISLGSLVLFAVVIAAGVVYNAGRVTLAERGRELASLRVLGFTHREVATMLLGEQAVLLAAAIPAGLAIGAGLAWLVVSRFASSLFRIPLIISPWSRGFAVGVVLVAAVASGAIIWRRIGRFDLVAVLKTRE